MSEQKFPPLAIDTIARIFASKDAESPLYFKGPQLVNLFNGLGFPDHYSFVDGKGIRTLDYGDGLSRYAYALRRLEKLNESFKVPSAIQAFVNASQQPMEAIRAFQDKLEAWGIQVYAKDGQVSESQDKEEALPYLPDVLIDNRRTTPQDHPEGMEAEKDRTDEQNTLETDILQNVSFTDDTTKGNHLQYGDTVTVGVQAHYKFIWPLQPKEQHAGGSGGTNGNFGANTDGMNNSGDYSGDKTDSQLKDARESYDSDQNNIVIEYKVPGLKYYPDQDI